MEPVDVLVALQRDVVAEPLGLLVGVGVAADVGEQRGVVDDRPLLLVEAEVLGKAERDPALAQHVLHRLAEPEIDAERQRTDELGQANRFEIGRLPHAGVMVGPVEEPWAGGEGVSPYGVTLYA